MYLYNQFLNFTFMLSISESNIRFNANIVDINDILLILKKMIKLK